MNATAFCDRHAFDPWCILETRPKLLSAILTLVTRVPRETLEELPHLVFIAPEKWQRGICMPAPTNVDAALLYFSPDLERMSQEQNDFTLAHEVAHASLGHYRPEWLMSHQNTGTYHDVPQEQQADALVASWGYKIPAYRVPK